MTVEVGGSLKMLQLRHLNNKVMKIYKVYVCIVVHLMFVKVSYRCHQSFQTSAGAGAGRFSKQQAKFMVLVIS